MSTKFRKAFFAFPSTPNDLTAPIKAAAEAIKRSDDHISVQIWPQMEVFGASIPDEIKSEIQEADILICDITKPNMNVYYEAGFAIGQGKTVAPVINTSFANVVSEIQRDGLFDNIGFKTYDNSLQLTQIMRNLPSTNLIDLYSRPVNFQQPLFLLDSYRKTDFRNAIVSAVKSSRVFYRSFDPAEVPRFSTVPIIGEVTSSSGVIIPILADHVDDAQRHNLRAAFLSGLAYGLGRQALLIQLERQDQVNPADYRDFILSVRSEGDVTDSVIDFSKNALLATQSIGKTYIRTDKSALQRLTLGASAAENEFRTLEEYFVETAEFGKTLRGEINIVAGRKGSGKTAIFFRVRDKLRQDKSSIVTDLKPESHQLSLFREELLKLVGSGVFEHTLAAFWQFVMLTEILFAIKKYHSVRARNDSKSLAITREIDETIAKFEFNDSGDFTSRINRLGTFILLEIERATSRRETLSPERLTNIIFKDGISQVKSLVQKHTDGHSKIILLFDNIDKGWPASGVDAFDIRLVRLLIESLDKIRRDFDAHGREFFSVVFLRNDIYELLVEETPDRGKSGQTRIDWTDRAKLRQVIFRRMQSSLRDNKISFSDIWDKYFESTVKNRDSFEYFVDHCLMRPRFLINIIENAIANAINRGNSKVVENDCIDAVRQHSYYLVNDFGYEIRDVSGLSADLLYSLVGTERVLNRDSVIKYLKDFGLLDIDLDNAFRLLTWYGVLGILTKSGQEKYVYDYEYNMKRLDAEIRVLGGEAQYVINPALHVALDE
ncbi:Cdc6-like AAA superfamily ATPase [Inquilinus ginsengisoli]|uniref:Cdc6-like AAA superfamily ATPase n=1 Tax=Inquilinus ginsengisoli TaxID=363840 RepID=A0ABU1JVS2_9PROT|nr:hypothetical protein [Inquilinus ginsengisoli]MDR6291660.1 Cdc6-like AAA superfamily ATPase [Inquilinus ginsengisoli]